MSLALTIVSEVSFACDGCNNSLNQGSNPDQSFVGIHYRHRAMGERFLFDHAYAQERYNQLAVYGKWKISREMSATLLFPYAFNTTHVGDGDEHQHTHGGDFVHPHKAELKGLADVRVQIDYRILSWTEHKIAGDILIGAGLKLPTGKYREKENGQIIDPHIQPGTGSWDPLVALVLNLNYRKFALRLNQNLSFNTYSPLDYKFGNSGNIEAMLTYRFDPSTRFQIKPALGTYIEILAVDCFNSDAVSSTGGTSIFYQLAINVIANRYALNFKSSFIAADKLKGNQIQNFAQLSAGVAYILKNKK